MQRVGGHVAATKVGQMQLALLYQVISPTFNTLVKIHASLNTIKVEPINCGLRTVGPENRKPHHPFGPRQIRQRIFECPSF